MPYNIALILEQKFDSNAGGVQQSTSKLATIFKENGHHVIIISVFQTERLLDQWDSISVYYTGKEVYKEIKEILFLNKVNIVINQAGYNVSLTKLIRQGLPNKAALINTLRINPLNFVQNYEIYIGEFLKRWGINFMNNKLTKKIILKYHYRKQNREYLNNLSNVDTLVLLSDNFKQEVFQLCPKAKFLQEKITAIPNPFKIANYKYSFNTKQNIILFVGRLTIVQKRVDILMSLWNKLHDDLPDWEFWIVGYGEEEKNMKEFCDKNKLNRIRFFGKDNPEKYYEKAKILHFTSAFEGFGNVLVEAQRYGCVPILFDSYAAAKDIVIDSKSGFLIKPFDENDYIMKTLSIIHDNQLLESLGIGAINNAQRFSYENIYKLWNSLFEELIPLEN